MKLSKQLYKIANDLHPYYQDILRTFSEFAEIAEKPQTKQKFEDAINIIREHPEILDLLHLPFDQQYQMYKKFELKIRKILDLSFNINLLKFSLLDNPRKARTLDFIDKLFDLKTEIYFFDRAPGGEHPTPDYLGSGVTGKVFKEEGGYARKTLTLNKRKLKNYQWLAEQDFNFYQQVPIVRVYNVKIIDRFSDDYIFVKILMDEITPYPKYVSKLKETKEKRWVIFKDFPKLINDQTIKNLIKSDTARGDSMYQLPNGKTLSIYDVHFGNFGIYINQGTKENPDRIVHIDLDTLTIR